MVCASVDGDGERPRISEKAMEMGSERSKALHNFTLSSLKWGNQRYLRCKKPSPPDDVVKVDRRSPVSRTESSPATRRRELERRRKRDWKPEEGIEAVREKLMFDLKTAANKMKDALRKEVEEEEEEIEEEEEMGEESAVEAMRPWNLRTRRAHCKAPIEEGKGLRIGERKNVNSSSPLRSDNNGGVRSARLRGGVGGAAVENKEERTKLMVSLSRKEVEEDFMAILGQRPARRPKKRHMNVQKQLDVSTTNLFFFFFAFFDDLASLRLCGGFDLVFLFSVQSLFPGLWLSEVTLDLYKVPESAENDKVIALSSVGFWSCLVAEKFCFVSNVGLPLKIGIRERFCFQLFFGSDCWVCLTC
jgi:hypothetical protein